MWEREREREREKEREQSNSLLRIGKWLSATPILGYDRSCVFIRSPYEGRIQRAFLTERYSGSISRYFTRGTWASSSSCHCSAPRLDAKAVWVTFNYWFDVLAIYYRDTCYPSFRIIVAGSFRTWNWVHPVLTPSRLMSTLKQFAFVFLENVTFVRCHYKDEHRSCFSEIQIRETVRKELDNYHWENVRINREGNVQEGNFPDRRRLSKSLNHRRSVYAVVRDPWDDNVIETWRCLIALGG